MRKLTLVTGLLALVATPAFADFSFEWTSGATTLDLTAVAQVKLDGGLATNSAFGVTLVSGQLKGSIYTNTAPPEIANLFRTFCVESTVYFSPGTTYWASIDPVAYSGGVGPAGDAISDVTEYIYDQYLLTKPTDAATLTAMRDAIWWAEGEGGSKNAIAKAALYALYGDEDYSGTLGLAGHTYALNLWTIVEQDGKYIATDVQSHLITTPVPAAVLLGMLGLGAAGMRLRRFV
jgi:hypothetical protein